jgi:hypothetical protein
VYESSTLKILLEFNREKLLLNHNIEILGRRHRISLLSSLAMNLQANHFAMVFKDKPNQCYLYDIDLQDIERKRSCMIESFHTNHTHPISVHESQSTHKVSKQTTSMKLENSHPGDLDDDSLNTTLDMSNGQY